MAGPDQRQREGEPMSEKERHHSEELAEGTEDKVEQ